MSDRTVRTVLWMLIFFLLASLLYADFGLSTGAPSITFGTDVLSLKQDRPVVAEITGGDRHVFLIEPSNSRELWFDLQQEGLALDAFILDQAGRIVLRTHCDEGILCRGRMSWLPAPLQSYILVLYSKPTVTPVCYRLSLNGTEDLSSAAVLAASAFQWMTEAEAGLLLRRSPEAESAIPKYFEALQRWNVLGQQDRAAESYCRIGDALAASGRNQEAIAYYRIAMGLWQAMGDSTNEAYGEIRMGEAALSLADAQGAMEHLSTALAYFSGSGNDHGQALALHDLGVVLYNIGDANEALKNYRRSLVLWPPLGERRAEAVTLMSAAAAYADIQEFYTAIDLNRQALEVLRVLGDRGVQSSVLSNIGLLYNDLGEFQKALDSSLESLEIKRETGDLRGEAVVLNNLGLIYHNSGDLEQAFSFYMQALPMRRKASDAAGEAATLNNIGKYYMDRGDLAKALESFQSSYSLIRRTGYRSSEASVLRNLAQTEIHLRDYAFAERDLNLAREIFLQLKDRAAEASCLTELARIRVEQGNDTAATDLYTEALVIMKSVNDRPGEARVLLELARIDRGRGLREEAAKYAEESIRILESIRAELLSHALRVTYLSASRNAYEFYVDLLYELHELHPNAGYAAVAFRVSEGAHARVLSDFISEGAGITRSGADPELLERERTARTQLSARQQARLELLTRAHTPEEEQRLTDEIQSLNMLVEQLEARIRRENPAGYSLLLPAPAKLSDVQEKLLGPDTVLLEFLVGKDRGFVWVVTPDQCLMYSIPGSAEIQKRVLAVFRELSVQPAETLSTVRLNSERKLWHLSRELGRLLLSPAAETIKNKRLLIVGDGALQVLPFAMLQLSDSERPLGVDHEIVYLPSATSLILLRQEKNGAQPSRTIAVLADPVFDPTDPRIQAPSGSQKWLRSPQSLALSRVPFTRREARAILQFAPKQQSLLALDAEASRETLQDEKLYEYRYIHIATHGIFDTEKPELSGLVLSLYGSDGRRLPGFMTSSDIFHLRLNADLVVLSGCSTALGEDVRGEGLVGLVRAFMYAGSRGVLASLWSVQDATTVELMSYFYRLLFIRKLTVSAALQQTQKFMWEQDRYRSPYYWAAFVLVGEYEVSGQN